VVNADKEKLISIIKKHLPTCTIYLFGSRSTKTNVPTSDIDLAIDSPKKIDLDTLGAIIEEIEE
jgi:predicted nucleotidyltransferase